MKGLQVILVTVRDRQTYKATLLQCFCGVGRSTGRASSM